MASLDLDFIPVLWHLSRHLIIAISTQQAEYLALSPAMQDLLWIQMLLKLVEITSETTCLKNAWNGNQTVLNGNGISLDTNWSNRWNLISTNDGRFQRYHHQ